MTSPADRIRRNIDASICAKQALAADTATLSVFSRAVVCRPNPHALSADQFQRCNIQGETEPMCAQFGARVPVARAAFIARAGGNGSQRGTQIGSKKWRDRLT